MELRALRYFVTVAEELHFGRAAERLHIAQPAVSQQVARLERELGVHLLDRSPRLVRLTDAGQRVLKAARHALAAAERVRDAAHELPDTVRIGTAEGLTSRLEHGIDALRDKNPELDVILVDLPVTARLDALRRGELDIALARGVTAAPGLRVLPAWSEALHVVVSTRHPISDRQTADLRDLAGYVLRYPSHDSDPALHQAVTVALRDADIHPELGRPAGTTQDTIVEVGSDPRSWALLPADQVAGFSSTRVRSIPLDVPIAVAGSVIIRDDHTPSRCVEITVAAFQDSEG